jgi:hypothetical protein
MRNRAFPVRQRFAGLVYAGLMIIVAGFAIRLSRSSNQARSC